jgi:hypothetical protein
MDAQAVYKSTAWASRLRRLARIKLDLQRARTVQSSISWL